MTIQSAMNSMLSDASSVAFRVGVIQHMKKSEKWFGDKPTKDKLTKEEKTQNKTQEKLNKSGETQRAEELRQYVEENEREMNPGEVKALQNVVEKTDTFRNQKEGLAQRKEFAKKILEGVYSPLTDPRKGGN